jgi:uncharacterized delta-60 repeat protein
MSSTPRFWSLVFAFSLTSALLISRSGNWMSHSVIVTERSRTSHKGAVQTQPTLATPKSTHILAANELDQNSATKAAAADHALNTAFIAWTTRYLSVPATNRETLLPEGIELARSRRPLFKELIRRAPRAALAAAIPREIRHQLPAEVLAELEKLVSTRAELAVIQTCLHPPGVEHDHAGNLYRATVIDDREYRVHVYGTRLRDASLSHTSLIGIAVDREVAVSENRYRVLSPQETIDGRPLSVGKLAVEAEGRITLLPSPEELPAFAASLIASENNPVINEADSGSGSSGVTGRPTQSWTHGDKKLLVIRVDFSDLPGTPINKNDSNAEITPAYIENVLNGTNGVRAFLSGNSFGKSDLIFSESTDVTEVLRLPNTAANYAASEANSLLHTHARGAAAAAGHNLNDYNRIAVVFSYLGNIPGSRITYGGLGDIIGENLWTNGSFDLRVVAHELGHNYGLRHANLWSVNDGNPVSPNGTSLEYGDPFDIMGKGNFFNYDFSHWNKSLLQWLPDSTITVANCDATYRIYRFDSSKADLTLPRALKIVCDNTRDYWIGYRRGLDNAATDGGAYVLWGYNTAQQGNLIDLLTPGSNPANAPLPLLSTFNDTDAGITIRPTAQGGSDAEEWLDLQVTFQPRIQWAKISYLVNEQGGSAVLTATRTANATGAVSVNYTTSDGTALSNSDYTTTSGTLTWTDGDTATKTVTIPLTADTLVEGTEAFTVTLSSISGGVIVDNAATTVTLADPGARDTTFAANFINSTINCVLVQPDNTLLVAGWFNSLQDSSFNTYSYGSIARLSPNGKIDTDFDPGTGANAAVYALVRQPDGKILIGGDFTSYNGTARNRIARLNFDGSLDTSFDPGSGANNIVYALLIQPDGSIIVSGSFTDYNGTARNGLVRINSEGSIDLKFANFSGSVVFSIRTLALQTDGKILVGGAFYHPTGNLQAGLKKLNVDGSVDATFSGLVAGASEAFQTNFLGTIEEIAVQTDGKILIAGNFSQFNGAARNGIARLSTSGALDETFNPGANATVSALLPLPDGTILIGGDFTTIGGAAATHIARLDSTGTLDIGFAAAGGHANTVKALALQSDGNVMLAGAVGSFQNASPSRPLWRLVPGLSFTPGIVQFSTDSAVGVEGTSTTLTVTRTGGSLGALTVGYSSVVGTASSSDFIAATGFLTWADGENTAKTIIIPITADTLAETAETFLVNLGEPQIGGTQLGDRQQATITVSSAFVAWQKTSFTNFELADAALSGETADPDADAIPNLSEFAFGLSAKTSNPTGGPTTEIQNINETPYLTLTFRRRTPALDLAYAVQTSDDLTGAWTPDAIQVDSSGINGDGIETVTYRDSATVSGNSKRFMRLQIIRTP